MESIRIDLHSFFYKYLGMRYFLVYSLITLLSLSNSSLIIAQNGFEAGYYLRFDNSESIEG